MLYSLPFPGPSYLIYFGGEFTIELRNISRKQTTLTIEQTTLYLSEISIQQASHSVIRTVSLLFLSVLSRTLPIFLLLYTQSYVFRCYANQFNQITSNQVETFMQQTQSNYQNPMFC